MFKGAMVNPKGGLAEGPGAVCLSAVLASRRMGAGSLPMRPTYLA